VGGFLDERLVAKDAVRTIPGDEIDTVRRWNHVPERNDHGRVGGLQNSYFGSTCIGLGTLELSTTLRDEVSITV
jgi:hypothetical protein